MSGWKGIVKRQFSEKAGSYDRYAQVQKEMAHQLVRQITAASAVPHDILEIGCGTGYFTGLLLERHPQAAYKAIDIAPGMVEEASSRFAASGRSLAWIVADVEEWAAGQPDHSFDLIVSNACFQWLIQPEETVAHLHRLLRPGGRLCFSTFGPRTFTELHDSFAKAYAKLGQSPARHGLSFRSPSEWERMMRDAGFHSIRMEVRENMYCFPNVRQFLHSVKEIGASATQAASGSGLGQRRLIMEMMQQYESRYRISQGIPVTYEIILAAGHRA
jgi:malonyl-CoA O-methyltransferase